MTVRVAPRDALEGLRPQELETLLSGLPAVADERQSTCDPSLVKGLGEWGPPNVNGQARAGT